MKTGTWKKTIVSMAILLMMMLVTPTFLSVQAASKSVSVYKNGISYYKKGNYAEAQSCFNTLPKKANESCVKKMSSGMKKAYKKLVKKYAANLNAPFSFSKPTPVRLHGYYLTDIDGDKKAELIIKYGTCEADMRVNLYKYKGGKAVKTGKTWASHSSFYQYPSGKGVIRLDGHMSYEAVGVIQTNGKEKVITPGEGRSVRESSIGYIELPYQLDYHLKYKNGKIYVDYSPFK